MTIPEGAEMRWTIFATVLACHLVIVPAGGAAEDGGPTWHERYEFTAGIGQRVEGRNDDTAVAAIPELVLYRSVGSVQRIGVVLGVPWYNDTVSGDPRAEAGLRYERSAGKRLRFLATGGLLVSLDPSRDRHPDPNKVDPFADVRFLANDQLSLGLRVERVRDGAVPYVTCGTIGTPGLVATAVALLLTAVGTYVDFS